MPRGKNKCEEERKINFTLILHIDRKKREWNTLKEIEKDHLQKKRARRVRRKERRCESDCFCRVKEDRRKDKRREKSKRNV